MAQRKQPARVAFEFVLDLLGDLDPVVKPFFGAHGVYVGPKLMLILREKSKDLDDGVWVATTVEHHASLRREFPSLRAIGIFGPGEWGWQVLPSSVPDFESSVTRVAELILEGDARIGRLPKPRRVSSSRSSGAPPPRAKRRRSRA